MFFVFFTLCSSSILGIDLGRNYLKASILSKDKPLHFAINSNSKRLTPNYFAFWNRTRASNYTSVNKWDQKSVNEFEWAFGDVAREQCLRYPKLCIRGLPILDNKIYYNLRGYEIAALSLETFIQSILKAEKINDTVQIVVALPPMMTPHEKSFLYAALSILKYEVVQFIDSTTAPAYVYGLERYKGENDKVVAFVDVGAKGTRVSIFNFDNSTGTTNITQLAVQCNESIGGMNIDYQLAENVAFKNHVNMKNIKTRFNFLDDISMVKEMLTNHPSVDLKFEEDDDDVDEKIITITRKELNEVGTEMSNVIEDLVNKALIQANLNKSNTKITVEMIGGCSHIQFIEDKVKEAFNVSKLSHTLNSNSVIAIGAGYIGAERSQQFIVRAVNKSFMLTQPVILQTDNKFYKIFNQGDGEDSSPTIQLSIESNQQFVIADGSTLTPYMRFSISNLTESRTNVEISFIHNYFLMPVPLGAYVPNKNINYDIVYNNIGWEVPTDELIKSGERVSNLIDLQKQRRDKEVLASKYEEELFNLQNFLRVAKNITEEEIKTIENVIKEGLDWFENISIADDIKFSKDTYQEKIDEILNKTSSIVQRGMEHSRKRLMLQKIKKSINKSKKLLEESLTIGKVNSTLQDEVLNEVEKTEKWVSEIEEKIDSILSKEIESKREILKKKAIELKKNMHLILKKIKKEEEGKQYNEL